MHGADTKVAETGIERERVAFLLLGKEESYIRHGGSKIAATETAQQRQDQHDPVGRIRILDREADAKRRSQQRPGSQGCPEPSTEDGHHETVEYAQRGTGQAWQGSQPEQLTGRVTKTNLRQFGHHNRPHHPDREGQEQGRDRQPKIAIGNFLPRLLPEGLILGAPVRDQFWRKRLIRRDIVKRLHFR